MFSRNIEGEKRETSQVNKFASLPSSPMWANLAPYGPCLLCQFSQNAYKIFLKINLNK